MPHSDFFLRIKIFSALAAIVFAMNAHAADWRECEKAKLRELQLQQSADHKTSKRKSQRRHESRRQNAEEIDTWLWKNCREFSYELRQLEQERM